MNANSRKDYIWNTAAGFINAVEAVIMSMIITRTTGLTDAGYITIGFAVGNLLMTVGKYGIYSFQVTDHNSVYSFSVYLKTRIITASAMLICLTGYLIYGYKFLHYSYDKTLIVLFIGLIYVIEALEDLLKAHCQYIGRLYIGAYMFIVRWSAIICTFTITILVTYNTALALGMSFMISAIVFAICSLLFKNKLYKQTGTTASNGAFSLLVTCFPLFLSAFLSFYIVNSSKYAIERYLDAKVQACYGFVAMPVFAIELLNSFIYQPQLVSIASDYNDHKTDSFIRRMRKQYIIIAILAAVCILGAYFLGIPFLSILYHTNLNDYLPELLILLLGGGFLALSGYQGIILTIMRRQKFQLYGYIPVSILAFLFVGPAVKKYGTIGAAFSYLVLIMILCILYETFIRRELKDVS